MCADSVPIKPEVLPVNFDAIPGILKERPQWLMWRYVWVTTGKPRWSKVPFFASGRQAQSNNPDTWVPFAQAMGSYLRHPDDWDGVGFCFSKGDGLAGIDLDHVFDPVTGEIDIKARDVLAHFAGTYGEISPSGTGFRIFCLGSVIRSGSNCGKPKWAEIYDYRSPRYLTVTGNHWVGCSGDVTEQLEGLNWIHGAYFDNASLNLHDKNHKSGDAPNYRTKLSLSDSAILDKAMKAKNGGKFRALWDGSCSEFVKDDGSIDRSVAAAALCAMMVFWCQGDASQVDRLFRQSGLYSLCVDKWDKKHGADGRTWGQMTIDHALSKTIKFYQPHAERVQPSYCSGDGEQYKGMGCDSGAMERDDVGGSGNVPPEGEGDVDDVDPRPEVQIGEDRLVTAMQRAEGILFEKGKVPYFQRGGMLVKIQAIDKERRLNDGIKRQNGTIVIQHVTSGWLTARMMEEIRFYRFVDKKKKPCNLPESYPKTYMERADWWVPVLNGISQVPVLRADGSIHHKEGFDPKTGIYLDSHLKWHLPPERKKGEKINPLRDKAIQWAVDVFRDVFQPFSPETEHDLSVMVSGVLTGLVKPLIGASPGIAVTSPTPGSGKGKIVHIISIALTGHQVPLMTWSDNEVDMKKALFSALLAGERLIAIDEIRGRLKNAELDSMLTEAVKTDRVLNMSKNAVVKPNETSYFAIGNNINVPGDSSRRWLRCYIDPACESPHLRVFERDALQHAKDNRIKIVCAGLTILHSFFFLDHPILAFRWVRLKNGVISSVVALFGLVLPIHAKQWIDGRNKIQRSQCWLVCLKNGTAYSLRGCKPMDDIRRKRPRQHLTCAERSKGIRI